MTETMSNSRGEIKETNSKNGYTPEQGAIAARELLNGALLFHRKYGDQFIKSAIREADILLSHNVRESSFYLIGFIRDSISGSNSEITEKLKSLVRYYQILKLLSHHDDVTFDDLLSIYPSTGFEENEKYKLAIDHLLHGFHFVYLQNVLLQSDFTNGFVLDPLPRVNGIFTNTTGASSRRSSNTNPNTITKDNEKLFDDKSESSFSESGEYIDEDNTNSEDDDYGFRQHKGDQIIGSSFGSSSSQQYVFRGDLEMIGAEEDGEKKSFLKKTGDAALKYSGVNFVLRRVKSKKKDADSETGTGQPTK